jgi:hypothetical protein
MPQATWHLQAPITHSKSVRLLKENFSIFQGKSRANCWWTRFSKLGFDPELGWDYLLENEHGSLFRIWVFVDDFSCMALPMLPAPIFSLSLWTGH